LISASAGSTLLAAVVVYSRLFRLLPPTEFRGEIRENLIYTAYPNRTTWWSPRVGHEVRVTDFGEWQGATAIWRGLFQGGTYVPGTGYPVLVVRVKREGMYFRAPTDVPLPPGLSLFYDDASRDLRLVVLFDRCTHLCAYSSWHVETDPGPSRDYTAPTPTFEVFGQDPVYCLAHGAQFDPLLLVHDVNNRNLVDYVGAAVVHDPATRALPVIPVKAVDDVLVGGMGDPGWYEYC